MWAIILAAPGTGDPINARGDGKQAADGGWTSLLVTDVRRRSLGWLEDEALGQTDIGLLDAVGIVLEPYCIAYLVAQLLGSLRQANLRGSGFSHGAGR